MYARITRVQIHAERLPEATRLFREVVVPQLHGEQGFNQIYACVDDHREALVLELWDAPFATAERDWSGEFRGNIVRFWHVFVRPPEVSAYNVVAAWDVGWPVQTAGDRECRLLLLWGVGRPGARAEMEARTRTTLGTRLPAGVRRQVWLVHHEQPLVAVVRVCDPSTELEEAAEGLGWLDQLVFGEPLPEWYRVLVHA